MNGIRLTVVVLATFCCGCARAPEAAPAPAERPVADRVGALNGERTWQWSHSCALCHVTGNGGAPRIGHPEDWAPRLVRGRQSLLDHAIEGFNNMPPLGYCMSCERDDLRALIEFMLPRPAPGDGR